MQNATKLVGFVPGRNKERDDSSASNSSTTVISTFCQALPTELSKSDVVVCMF